MFNRIFKSRRSIVYRNQLMVLVIIVAAFVFSQIASPFLYMVCIIWPALICLAILYYAGSDLIPSAKDGTTWNGVMIITNPGVREARTHILHHTSITVSDNTTAHDIYLENNSHTRSTPNKRGCIIYCRESGEWWVRNIGEREIIVDTPTGQVTLPGRNAKVPSTQRECQINAGSRCTFYNRNQEIHSVIEFRGSLENGVVPSQRILTLSSEPSFVNLWQASIAHYQQVFIAVAGIVVATWCLLYATDSGVYNSSTSMRTLQSSLANWQSLAVLFLIATISLTSLFVGTDVMTLVKGYVSAGNVRRPKRMLLALFMILMMAGTVVGFRTEGRLLGANHIKMIMTDNDLQQIYKSQIPECFQDPKTSFADMVQTPTSQLSAPCQLALNNALTSKGTRNAPGATALMLQLFICGFGIASLFVWFYGYQLQLTKQDTLTILRQRLFNLWQRANLVVLNQSIAIVILIIIAILAYITSPDVYTLQITKMLGVPLEIYRFVFFVTVMWTVAYEIQRRQDYANLIIAPLSTMTNSPVQRVITIGYSYLGRAIITTVLLGAVAFRTKDFGPFLAYGLLFFFVTALYSTRRRWMVTGMLILVCGIVGINFWRADITDNAFFRRTILPHTGSSVSSWLVRPSDPPTQINIKAQLQPYVNTTNSYDNVYDDWYTSKKTFPIQCVNYLAKTNICATDASLRQSLYSIISGRMVGMGPGLGLSNPPDPFAPPLVQNIHNDFVLVVIFEEYGLTGGIIIIITFYLITASLLIASQRIKSRVGQVIAAGVGLWWSVQLLLVIIGNLRFLPFAGMSTPFISNGNAIAILTIISVCATLWVSTMPYRVISDSKTTHIFNYRALQIMMALCSLALVICIILMQTGFAINTDLYQQINAVQRIVPNTPKFNALSRESKLGRRLICLFVRRPINSTIEDAQHHILVAFDKEINGCKSHSINFAPVRAYSESLADLLPQLIYDANYQQQLYYPHKNFSNQANPMRLTIDGTVQHDIEQIFDNSTDAAHRTISGQVVVIGYDGAIKALVNRYHYIDEKHTGLLAGGTSNILQGMFTPGSVWKPFIASAAISKGMQLTDEIPCDLGQQIYGFERAVVNSFGRLNCKYAAGSDTQGTNYAYALSYSVNTFFTGLTDASVASVPGSMPGKLPLSRADVLAQLNAFGITKVTQPAPWSGWSLPDAQSASVAGFSSDNRFDDPNVPEFGLSAMGQGSPLASPLAMAAAMQIIANDGVAHTIHLVQGDTVPNWDNQQRITLEHAQALQNLLFDSVRIAYDDPIVIDNVSFRLAGAAAVLDDNKQHLVAGKTGTAEIRDDVNPYCANISNQQCPPLSWFVGFSPQAQSIVVVMVRAQDIDNPSPCSAAGIAGTVFEYLLKQPQSIPCSERGR